MDLRLGARSFLVGMSACEPWSKFLKEGLYRDHIGYHRNLIKVLLGADHGSSGYTTLFLYGSDYKTGPYIIAPDLGKSDFGRLLSGSSRGVSRVLPHVFYGAFSLAYCHET